MNHFGHYMRIIITRSLILSVAFLCSCAGEQSRGDADANPVETKTVAHTNDSIPQEAEEKKTMNQPERYEASLVLENYLVPQIQGKDFTEINSETVIFFLPDAKEIKALKKSLGEENFYTVSDDNMYYTYEAEIFLEGKGIRSVYPGTRYLKFTLSNGRQLFFDAKAKAHLGWTTVLFTPGKMPEIINPIDIETAARDYFGK